MNGGGQRWNDVWGFKIKGKEYAVIGGTAGIHFIDVDSCKERAFIYTPLSTGVIHRDFKSYRNYLYCVADEGFASAMLVFDLSYLPDSVKLVWASERDTIARAHNIFIDTATAKLYCGSPKTSGATYALSVFSLANPAAPSFICQYPKSPDLDLVHDLYVRNDTAWCSDGYNGFMVLDMSTLPNYRTLGGLATYPFQGFNHSSWMGYDYIGVMADETFGMPIKVIDASKPSAIRVLSTFSPRPGDTTCIPHNPYILEHYALVSYYMDGLQIYDLKDPRNPVQAGYYDTYPDSAQQQYAGAWGCYPFLPSRRILVSDMQTGLYVFDASEAMPDLSPVKEGIYHPNATQLEAFPNPASDIISFNLPLTGTMDYTIYNATGGLALCGRGDAKANTRTDLSLPPNLAPGFYMLRAAIDGQSFVARFIKR